MKSIQQFGHRLWMQLQLTLTQPQHPVSEEQRISSWPLRFVVLGTELLALGIILVYWWGRSRGQ